MGTEVLRPQDCLVERLRVSPAGFHGPSRKSYFPNGYTKTNRKQPTIRTDPKKRFNNHQQLHHESRRLSSADDAKAIRHTRNQNNSGNGTGNGTGNGPVMGQVTILRRGESLDSLNSKIKKDGKSTPPPNKGGGDLVAFGTERLGPEQPEMLPKQIRLGRPADVYAGSAFSVSPSPSSLPLPSFFKKQEFKSFDDSATRDLRRLLRLE